MPYDEGLAHFYLGRHLLFNAPFRREHLIQAIVIFEKHGVARELRLARTTLED